MGTLIMAVLRALCWGSMHTILLIVGETGRWFWGRNSRVGWSQWDLGDLSSRVCQLSVHHYCQLVWCVVSKRCPRACLFMHVWVCCVCMCVCMRAQAHLGLFLAQGSSICSTRVLPVEALSHAYGKEPMSPTVLDPPPPPLAPLHLACLDRPCQPLFYPREPWAIPRISLGEVG